MDELGLSVEEVTEIVEGPADDEGEGFIESEHEVIAEIRFHVPVTTPAGFDGRFRARSAVRHAIEVFLDKGNAEVVRWESLRPNDSQAVIFPIDVAGVHDESFSATLEAVIAGVKDKSYSRDMVIETLEKLVASARAL